MALGAVVFQAKDLVLLGRVLDLVPGDAAVARGKHHPGAALAERQFFAPHDPAGVGIQEMDGAQRRAHAGSLKLPRFAAVDGVPNGPRAAYGPAFPIVDELDGVQRRITNVGQLGRADAGD